MYEGEFQKNAIEGYGTLNFKDGSQYKGEWANNKFHGKGTL